MSENLPPRRKAIRFPGYDYAQAGIYAFTVVVFERRPCLGSVDGSSFDAAPAGDIVREVWERLPNRFPTILPDAFVVMPNHVHGIVILGAQPDFRETDAINGAATVKPGFVAAPFMASPRLTTPSPDRETPVFVPPSRDPNAPALGEIVRSLKAASTTRIRKECLPDFQWQERYWDRIVRNDAELDRFRAYIETNPVRWTMDREYSDQ